MTRQQRYLFESAIHAAIFILAFCCFLAAHFWYQNEKAQSLDRFRHFSHQDSTDVKIKFEHVFREIYQSLRMMARFPGVRGIQRYAENLQSDDRQTIQEVYNNIASNIAVSEIYIVPRSMDPDQIDPKTAQKQAPITTFDQLIVGKTAESPAGLAAGAEPLPSEQIEEVEIYEYRLMKEQSAYFEKQFPNESKINGLDYPLVSGPEVITCDNSRYRPSNPNDADRSGLVFSVPFFGDDSQYKGMVSAVVLSSALGDQIPSGDYALFNKKTGYFLLPRYSGSAQRSILELRAMKSDSKLFYSEVLPVQTLERDAWYLWCGRSNEVWEKSPEMLSLKKSFFLFRTVMGLITLALILWARYFFYNRNRADDFKRKLEEQVALRTAELEASKVKAESASRAKSDFLANMSHEIRTPLNAIVGFSQLLSQTELKNNQKDFVSTIVASSDHLLGVINDILDFSKIESSIMELECIPFNLEYMAEDVLKMIRGRVREGQSVELLLQYDSRLPKVFEGDPTRVRQVLINLVGNAVKFTETGHVSIHVESGDRESKSVLIRVRDTGIGIMEEKLGGVFEAFTQADTSTTRKYGGTGLGLAICKKLVLLMRGTIQVQSKVGQGTTFTLHLPLIPSNALTTDSILPLQVKELGGKTIIIVDDNVVARQVEEALATELDMTILLSASSAKEALDWIRKKPEVIPDLILSDIMMPEMDGYQFAREIYQTHLVGKTTLVAVTSDVSPRAFKRVQDCGYHGFATKPIVKKELIQILCSLLGKKKDYGDATITRHTFNEVVFRDVKILVVDDNLTNQKLMCAILAKMGVQSDVADNGEIALKMLRENKYHLCLMDLQMPVMSGTEAAEQARAVGITIPIIALTAAVSQDDVDATVRSGMNDFLKKPVDMEVLRAKLFQWVKPSGQGGL